MKTMKKLASVALALVLALCLTVPAFAAEGDTPTGSITVTNAEPGQIYTLYKLFDLAYGGAGVVDESDQPEPSGSSDPHTYSILSTSPWYGFVKAAGEDAEAGPGASYVTLEASTENVGENVTKYYVTWKDGADPAAFAKLALTYAGDNSIGNQGSEKAPAAAEGATTSTVTFSGLELGYYLIDSSLGALCALDTTNFNANIREKNEKPTIDKDPVKLPEGVGDTIEYEVVVHAKKGAEKYVVHDTMSKGLTFDNNIKVYIRTKDAENKNVDTKLADTNYTVQTNVKHMVKDDEGNDTTEVASTCTFEVIFEQAYLNTLTADNTDIVVKYSATVNADAVEVDKVNNTAKLVYGEENETKETLPDDVDTPIYHFDLAKTTKDNVMLAGAKFQLQKVVDGTSTPITLFYDTVNKCYRPALEGEDGVTEFVTTTDKITFDGFGAGTYQLVELEAPKGYNKLKAPVVITIEQDKDAENKPMVDENGKPVMVLKVNGVKTAFDAKVTAAVEATEETSATPATWTEGGVRVENLTGFEMPSTGGIGTTIFYIAGAVLAVGAGVLLVTKKKMGSEEE